MTVRARDLLSLPFPLRVEGDEGVALAGVNSDSRGIVAGDLFAAIAGGTHDAARFAPDAVARGAAAVLCTRPLGLSVPTLVVDDVRKRLGPISHRICGEPTRSMPTVGITGTNGKTTVTHLLESVLAHAGGKPALLGTIVLRGPAGETPAQLTTPEADAIARFAREQHTAGATALLMEVSSHALSQARVGGMQFEVAGFTNLTQDHLDFHGTMDAYGEAKTLLFTDYAPKTSVIVVEQPFGRALAARAKGEVLRCAVTPGLEAELRVLSFASGRNGLRALIDTPRGELSVESPLYGVHNLENVLLTIGCALALGVDPHVAVEALRTAVGAPGRLERVPHPHDVLVLVDYAHTPDALERVIHAVRPMTRGRLLVLCGCGGDRDRTKRAPMGEVAAREGDIAILTSDNPRTEDPGAILADMLVGAERAGAPRCEADVLSSVREGFCVIPDRAQAIRATVAAAQPGDSIILAGKGHENYQIVGKTKFPFDDRVEAARAIAAVGGL